MDYQERTEYRCGGNSSLCFTLLVPLFNGDNQFLGKQIFMEKGQLRKPFGKAASYFGTVVECTDLAEFHVHLLEVNCSENTAIILGKPIGSKHGDEFHIYPRSKMISLLGKDDVTGIHEINGFASLARLKCNFDWSRIMMFDYDPDEDTPPEHIFTNVRAYLGALNTIVPGMADAGYIVTPSSSDGLAMADGTPLKGGAFPKWHIFTAIEDAEDQPRFAKDFLEHAWNHDMAWYKEAKINKKTGVAARLTRTICDMNTFSKERLVFEGKPTLGQGIMQHRELATLHEGPLFDTRSLAPLRPKVRAKLVREKGTERQVLDPKTNEIKVVKSLSTFGDILPVLSRNIKVVREDQRGTVYTLADFLKSEDKLWRVISELREPDMVLAAQKERASEILVRTWDGKAEIHEFDGLVRYVWKTPMQLFKERASKQRKAKPTPEYKVEDDIWSDFFGDHHAPEPLTLDIVRTLKQSGKKVHLLFGHPGQGKSQAAIQAVDSGYCVIFACASNEQAEEQFNNCKSANKELVLSRAYLFQQRYGLDPCMNTSDHPWEAPQLDSKSCGELLMVNGLAQSQVEGEDMVESLSSKSQPKDVLEKGTIIFTTQDRVKIWGRSNLLRHNVEHSGRFNMAIKKLLIFIDDLEYGGITSWKQVTEKDRKWINKQKSQGIHIASVYTKDGFEWIKRPSQYTFDQGLAHVKRVFTTTEQKLKSVLEVQYGSDIHIHDLTLDDGQKDTRSDLYIFGTDLTRSHYHHALIPMVNIWKQNHDFIFVADGLGAEQNHFTVRGQNSFMDTDILVKVSQPHGARVRNLMLDLKTEDEQEEEARYYWIIDQAIQAMGRNQGYRWINRRSCVIVCDLKYLQAVEESLPVRASVAGQARQLDADKVLNPFAKEVLETIQNPSVKQLTNASLRAVRGTKHDQLTNRSLVALQEKLDAREGKFDDLVDRIVELAKQKTSTSEIYRKLSLNRMKGYPGWDWQGIKSDIEAEYLFHMAIQSISDISDLREFERTKHLSRKVKDPQDRSDWRARVKAHMEAASPAVTARLYNIEGTAVRGGDTSENCSACFDIDNLPTDEQWNDPQWAYENGMI